MSDIRDSVETYFIRCRDTVKIGRSSDVRNRLMTLQAANPYQLTLLAVLPGDRENKLHNKFRAHRVRNEWYKLVPEIVRYIEVELMVAEHPLSTSGIKALNAAVENAGQYECAPVRLLRELDRINVELPEIVVLECPTQIGKRQKVFRHLAWMDYRTGKYKTLYVGTDGHRAAYEKRQLESTLSSNGAFSGPKASWPLLCNKKKAAQLLGLDVATFERLHNAGLIGPRPVQLHGGYSQWMWNTNELHEWAMMEEQLPREQWLDDRIESVRRERWAV